MSVDMIRNRYVGESVATASPERLVTMLYDRLVRDLKMAHTALEANAFLDANGQLLHAQEIIWELLAGLDTTKWEGGPALASLYSFLITELVSANMRKDAGKVRACLDLVEPLGEAWRKAAETVTGARVAVGG